MVDEHTAANEKLKTIAAGKGLTLPTAPAAKDAAAIAKMSKLSGAAFDSAYKKFAVASHTDAYKVFSSEVALGKDRDLKQFATDTLPTGENAPCPRQTVRGQNLHEPQDVNAQWGASQPGNFPAGTRPACVFSLQKPYGVFLNRSKFLRASALFGSICSAFLYAPTARSKLRLDS